MRKWIVGCVVWVCGACHGTTPSDASVSDALSDVRGADVTDGSIVGDVANGVDVLSPTDLGVPVDAPADAAPVGDSAVPADLGVPIDAPADATPVGDSAVPADATADGGPLFVPTASPCGGNGAVGPSFMPLPSGGARLLDLGHIGSFNVHQQSGERILARESISTPGGGSPEPNSPSHWVLWDAVHDLQIVAGYQDCTAGCPSIELQGSTLAVGTTNAAGAAIGAELRDATDGHVLATITLSGAQHGLALDGSYLWDGSTSGLSVWSTATGVLRFYRGGDYSTAAIAATPGEVRVAAGPAAGLIERIDATTGVSTSTPAVPGYVPRWFNDGSHLVTLTSRYATSGWIYNPDGTVAESVASIGTSLGFIGGVGNYWWSFEGDVFQVGASGRPAISFDTMYRSPRSVGAGGDQVAFATQSAGGADFDGLEVIRLLASGPVVTARLTASYSSFASDASGHWSIGNTVGLLYESRAPTYSLSCGAVTATAGSTSGSTAIATASGRVVILDVAATPATTLGEMPLGNVSALRWSDDGSLLLALTGTTSDTLTAYTMPGGTFLSVLYTSSGLTHPSFSASGDGHTVALTHDTATSTGAGIERTVMDLTGTARVDVTHPATGGPPVGSVVTPRDAVPVLSTDGTLAAFGPYASVIYSGTTAATTSLLLIPVGWVDDAHLVAVQYASTGAYTGVSIVSPAGAILSNAAGIPAMGPQTLLPSNRILAGIMPFVYNLTTGAIVWSASACADIPGTQASGGHVFCARYNNIVGEPLP